MESFLQWLQGEDRSTVSRHQQVQVSSPAATNEQKEPTQPVPEPTLQRGSSLAGDDIVILTQRYGALTRGMTIRLELNAACELLGRTRKRIDAFRLLQKKLQEDYGIQLIIYSRKTHV